jgi:hypothetical protein
MVANALISILEPQNGIRWLTESASARKLRVIIKSGREVTLDDFEESEVGRQMTFARDLFSSAGAITHDTNADARLLARWLDALIRGRQEKGSANVSILKQYAHWAVFRDFMRLVRVGSNREQSIKFAKRSIRGAMDFLEWLSERSLTLQLCTQNDIDVYLSGALTERRAIKFIKWAERRALLRPVVIPTLTAGAPGIASEDQMLRVLSRLLHDESLPLQTQAAGLLVTLYGQIPGRLRALRKADVVRDERTGVVSIVGDRAAALELEQNVGEIVWKLRSITSVHSGVASGVQNAWLFPGHRPGRSISESALATQLASIGVNMKIRGAALIELAKATDLTMLSDILDLCDQSAYRWWDLAGGDRGSYAGSRNAYIDIPG